MSLKSPGKVDLYLGFLISNFFLLQQNTKKGINQLSLKSTPFFYPHGYYTTIL